MEHGRFGADDGGYDSSNSSGGSSSPASPCSGPSDSDGSSSSSNADEFCPFPFPFPSELQRHAHASVASSLSLHTNTLAPVTESSAAVLDDIDRHQQRMLALLPAFSSSSSSPAARAEALSRWLAGFEVGWVLEMGGIGCGAESLPRREVGRRVRSWAQALSTMERVFRRRHRELTAAQVAALGELAAATARAMLRLAGAVAALGSSPSKLLAALDVYVPVSEAFPVLARLFSWGPAHPVSAAAEAALAAVVDGARACGRDLAGFVRKHYPWRMPQGGEVHPCVGFWMGYFRCMLRNRVSLFFVLGGSEDGEPTTGLGLVAELISCLEAVLEEKAMALAFPGLRQVFMLNNTFAIMRRAVRSDLKLFLPPGWAREREERMEAYIKGYMDASWKPVVARLDGGGGAKSAGGANILGRRRTNGPSAFYTALENVCSAQRCWKVPNPVIRGILRKTVAEKVVPAYRRYLEDHPEVEVANGRSAEELEQQLSELFEG